MILTGSGEMAFGCDFGVWRWCKMGLRSGVIDFGGREGCARACGGELRGLGGCLGLGRSCAVRFWACVGRVWG